MTSAHPARDNAVRFSGTRLTFVRSVTMRPDTSELVSGRFVIAKGPDDQGGDTMADAEKVDEEQEVRDADADTRDAEDAGKADEEQEVRDADADTRDVDSRLDEMWSMLQRMNGTLTKLSDGYAALATAGTITDAAEQDPTDDDGIGAAEDVFDLTITD